MATTRRARRRTSGGRVKALNVAARAAAAAEARTIIYVHGIGNKPITSVLKCQWDRALGDFNIFNRDDVTMAGLTGAGFVVPKGLEAIPGTNVRKDKHYDQIAYFGKTTGLTPTGRAGLFDFFDHVYRASDADAYKPQVPEATTYNNWRTFQMSDHLPMWCEFQIDDMDAYLATLKEEFAN